ncbi:MAG: SRPBCC family protein [Myxococcota bacterium]
MRTRYERSIDVDARPDEAYACWSRFSDFPRFVGALEYVTHATPDLTHWHARIAGFDCEWTAEVTERIPDRRIAWCSRSGVANAGCVTFHPLGPRRTRVMLQVDYEPAGWLEAGADLLGLPRRRLDDALEAFKEWVGSGTDAAASEPTAQARTAEAAPRLAHSPGPGAPPGIHLVRGRSLSRA